jgi:DNA gyrase subunit A
MAKRKSPNNRCSTTLNPPTLDRPRRSHSLDAARRRRQRTGRDLERRAPRSGPVALSELRALGHHVARAADVRDGLKPVQRRILYTMWQQNLTADVKHRKCAKVVGDVMGSYHPHGDSALYETLVRMAQPFSLRYPLVDGSGNFGSLDGGQRRGHALHRMPPHPHQRRDAQRDRADDGDVPAELRRDENRAGRPAGPAAELLVNGTTGIAVGMATNVPPHNLAEVCTALIKLLDNEDLTSTQLCRYIKGPDFPPAVRFSTRPTN